MLCLFFAVVNQFLTYLHLGLTSRVTFSWASEMLKWDKEDTVPLCSAPPETKLRPSRAPRRQLWILQKAGCWTFCLLPACLCHWLLSGALVHPWTPGAQALFRLHLFPGLVPSSLFIQQVRGEATVILFFSDVKAHHLSEQTVHIFIGASWLISSLSMACLSTKKVQSLVAVGWCEPMLGRKAGHLASPPHFDAMREMVCRSSFALHIQQTVTVSEVRIG